MGSSILLSTLFSLGLLTSPPENNTPPPYREHAIVQGVTEETQNNTYMAQITAYTAIETCSDTCVMASGKTAYMGAVACPRAMPLGTQVAIDDLGTFTCEDRTAQWVDGRFDVFFGYTLEDYDNAINWGSRYKVITILE